MNLEERIPSPLKTILRPPYWFAIGVRDSIYKIGDTYGLIGPNTIYGDGYYAKRKDDPYRSDAHHVSEVLNTHFQPNSVIDFGCAIGSHLEYFHDRGVDVLGVEAAEAAHAHAVLPNENMKVHDLRKEYDPDQQYDLVLSFEVAEHLPEKYADQFIETLVSAGQTVVMTAAEPGQEGTHHVNEKPRSYWKEKMRVHGYKYNSNAVNSIRDDLNVELTTWIPKNLFVFEKE